MKLVHTSITSSHTNVTFFDETNRIFSCFSPILSVRSTCIAHHAITARGTDRVREIARQSGKQGGLLYEELLKEGLLGGVKSQSLNRRECFVQVLKLFLRLRFCLPRVSSFRRRSPQLSFVRIIVSYLVQVLWPHATDGPVHPPHFDPAFGEIIQHLPHVHSLLFLLIIGFGLNRLICTCISGVGTIHTCICTSFHCISRICTILRCICTRCSGQASCI
uniref:Uncharacterized protein n=1 Tax=Cacopsylla melanoneura TaxID=428564 RepID=A0A8D8SQB1_9HEMI